MVLCNSVDQTTCRRVMLLKYFGEIFLPERCNKSCDNCQRAPSDIETRDMSDHGVAIAHFVQDVTQQMGSNRLTVLKLAKLYSRSKDKDTRMFQHLSRGSEVTAEELTLSLPLEKTKRVIQQMLMLKFLREERVQTFQKYSANYVILGEKVDQLLYNDAPLMVTFELRKKSSQPVEDSPLPLPFPASTSRTLPKNRSKSSKKEERSIFSMDSDEEEQEQHLVDLTVGVDRPDKLSSSFIDSLDEFSSSPSPPKPQLQHQPPVLQLLGVPSLLSKNQKDKFAEWLVTFIDYILFVMSYLNLKIMYYNDMTIFFCVFLYAVMLWFDLIM